MKKGIIVTALALVAALAEGCMSYEEYAKMREEMASSAQASITRDAQPATSFAATTAPVVSAADSAPASSVSLNTANEADAMTNAQQQFDDYISMVKQTVGASYLNNSVETDDSGNVIVDIWQNGLSFSADYARNGDELTKQAWETLKIGTQSLAQILFYSYPSAYGFNGSVTVNVLDDQDTGSALLSFVDGVCILDAVNG